MASAKPSYRAVYPRKPERSINYTRGVTVSEPQEMKMGNGGLPKSIRETYKPFQGHTSHVVNIYSGTSFLVLRQE